MKVIYDWLCRDAEWWQFWRPSSGAAGGIIMGAVISGIIAIIFFVIIK